MNLGELLQLSLGKTGESSFMRLSQNGMRSDASLFHSKHIDVTPPVDRQHPNHYVIVVELGKPVVFPCGWAAGVCELQSV